MNLSISLATAPNDYAGTTPLPSMNQPLYTEITAAAPMSVDKLSGTTGQTTGAGAHLGSIVQCYTEVTYQAAVATSLAGTNAWYLFSAPEWYNNSMALVMAGPRDTATNAALTNAGAINGLEMRELESGTQYMHFYAYDSDSSAVDNILYTQTSDHVLFCGKAKNKGVCSMHVTTAAGNDTGSYAD